MNLLNEMLTNEEVNLWSVCGSASESKKAIGDVIKNASKEDLEQLIIKFEGHTQFASETFICYEVHKNMSEDEYNEILDEHDL